jgi:cytochrome c peroxidase
MGAGLADPDRRTPTSKGVRAGLFGDRNTPSAAYMAFSPPFHFDKAEQHYVGGQFWDGRAATLEEQATQPFLNPVEMANRNAAQVVAKVQTAAYAPLFKEVFGSDAFADPDRAFKHIGEAIAAFERTPAFQPFSSKYDAWLAGRARLTPQELRGLKLFEREDKGNCAACHPLARDARGRGGLGTDFTYDNLGVPKNPDNPFYRLPEAHNPAGGGFVDRGLGGVVGQAGEYGKFKVPTVRNVELTAPYMHNGYFSSLRAVVDFYNTRDLKPRCEQEFVTEAEALVRRCWPRPEMVANVNSDELGHLRLSAREVDDIVAFMLTLTDGWQRRPNR